MQFEEYRRLQQETTIEELRVSYVVCGEGTPLLLIHGIPVWGYLWKDCIETLSQHFQLIIPDLVGYGYSDQRDCFDRSIKVQSHVISKLLQFLDVEDLLVAGHDIGGAVAQRFVVDHWDVWLLWKNPQTLRVRGYGASCAHQPLPPQPDGGGRLSRTK